MEILCKDDLIIKIKLEDFEEKCDYPADIEGEELPKTKFESADIKRFKQLIEEGTIGVAVHQLVRVFHICLFYCLKKKYFEPVVKEIRFCILDPQYGDMFEKSSEDELKHASLSLAPQHRLIL